jgi:hypothetical protein
VVPGVENRGLLAWVDFLKGEGVVQPNIVPAAPAPAPASKPATAPAK